jgi:hypothetical protein
LKEVRGEEEKEGVGKVRGKEARRRTGRMGRREEGRDGLGVEEKETGSA